MTLIFGSELYTARKQRWMRGSVTWSSIEVLHNARWRALSTQAQHKGVSGMMSLAQSDKALTQRRGTQQNLIRRAMWTQDDYIQKQKIPKYQKYQTSYSF